jgi:copper chaperone
METITLNVPGMSCSHCEHAIKGAVKKLDGVDDITINLTDKIVKVSFSPEKVTENSIRSAIEDQGYDIN